MHRCWDDKGEECAGCLPMDSAPNPPFHSVFCEAGARIVYISETLMNFYSQASWKGFWTVKEERRDFLFPCQHGLSSSREGLSCLLLLPKLVLCCSLRGISCSQTCPLLRGQSTILLGTLFWAPKVRAIAGRHPVTKSSDFSFWSLISDFKPHLPFPIWPHLWTGW